MDTATVSAEGRHLAAIMFVDMVGYSALMQKNESRAIAAVRDLWELVRPILNQHGGREVDLAGDGMLMEFPGALAAVRCAVRIQHVLHEQSHTLASEDRVRTRAGVHLGDIEHRDGRIYGDGINIAARLLPLAPAGGLVMTAHVRDQLTNVLEPSPQFLGSKTLKNIKGPIQIWCLTGPDCSAADLAAAKAAAQDETADRKWSFGAAVLDERTLELTVDGATVELEKKALDVLTFLLHHAGEVVTKDEILEAVWPGRVPSETVLTKCISLLREALKDEEQSGIKTVHGFGYRLAIPVKVEAISTAPQPHFEFRSGDHPPLRPLWSLLKSLGQGGHGEVWLARHDKTKEERVYKFALDPSHLASLKREITLSRVLLETPRKDSFVRMLDWNLEQLPYFLECDYCKAGSLVDWAEAQGGLDRVPLETRLELAALTAEALAAAHSVGVLHKDLKPSNVLIDHKPGSTPGIKLADFGSGGILDPHRLENLGITRMGFTRTILDASDSTSGTPLYLAPEIMAGQPWTSQADIYALGVMLYQLVVGNLKRTLAPGWERDVADELLQEDIAAAAAGNALHRLADASILAQRLRSLAERRTQLAAQRRVAEETRAAQVQAERAQQALERMRARRKWMLATAAALVTGLSATMWLYADARWAREEAQAVSRFLSEEVLGMANPGAGSRKDLTLGELIKRAGPKVDERLADFPLAAAMLHYDISNASAWLHEELPMGAHHAERAASLFEQELGPLDIRTLSAKFSLPYLVPKYADDKARILEEVLQGLNRIRPPEHPYVLTVRSSLATLDTERSDTFERGLASMRDIVKLAATSPAISPEEARLFADTGASREEALADAEHVLAFTLRGAGRYSEALEIHKVALPRQERIYGLQDWGTNWLRLDHGVCLRELGRLAEAEPEIRKAHDDMTAFVGPDNPVLRSFQAELGFLRFEQGRYAETEEMFREHERTCAESDRTETETGLCGAKGVSRRSYRLGLVLLHRSAGRMAEAVRAARYHLAKLEKISGTEVRLTTEMRIVLAELLRESDQADEAWRVLNGTSPGALAVFPDRHPIFAEMLRTKGLLWLRAGERDKARVALQQALDIETLRRGPEHWRAQRVRGELADASR